VKSNVSLAQASSVESVLPERIQEALGQLVGAAKEGVGCKNSVAYRICVICRKIE
jgi:hypothetical protein